MTDITYFMEQMDIIQSSELMTVFQNQKGWSFLLLPLEAWTISQCRDYDKKTEEQKHKVKGYLVAKFYKGAGAYPGWGWGQWEQSMFYCHHTPVIETMSGVT